MQQARGGDVAFLESGQEPRQGKAVLHWIVTSGVVVLGTAQWFAPALVLWLLPVALPMVVAPVLIAWSSLPSRSGLYLTPTELVPTRVMELQDEVMTRWHMVAAPLPEQVADLSARPARA